MARWLAVAAILIAVTSSLAVLQSCVQPVEAGATAEENFDTTVPDTPTITPNSAHETHVNGGVALDYYGNGVTQPELLWTATPGAPVRYRMDGGAWIGPSTTLTSPFIPPALGDGLHTFEIQERDASGNWSQERVYRFMVDNTPPGPPIFSNRTIAATADLTPTFYWFGDQYGGSRRFEATVSGPGLSGSPSYDFSNLPPGSEFSATPGTFSGSGNVTFDIREIDYAGNPSSYATFAMTIDVDGPTYTAQPASPTNQSTGNSWSWQSSGATGADNNFEWELRTSPLPGTLLDSGTVYPGPGSYTATSLGEGSYQFRVRESRNDQSSWSLWAESGVLTIDLTSPAVPLITAPSSGAVLTSSGVDFIWNGSGEAGGSFTYELTGPTPIGPANTASSSYTATGLGDGNYTFTLHETDAAGNASSPISVSFSVDATAPPAPTLTLVPAGASTDATPSFSWSGSGEAGAEFTYEISGPSPLGPFTNTATSYTSTALADGNHTFSVFETDVAGNVSSSAQTSFTIDTTALPPSGVASADLRGNPPNQFVTTYEPTFTWNAGESGASYAYSIDGGSTALNVGTLTSITLGPLAEGNYDFAVRQADSLGNVSGWSTSINFDVPTLEALAIWFETTTMTQDSSAYANTLSQDGGLGQVAPQIVASDYINLGSSIDAGYYVPTANNLHQALNGQTISFWILGNNFGVDGFDMGTILYRSRSDGAPSTEVFSINTEPGATPQVLRLAVNQSAQTGVDIEVTAMVTGWNHIVYVLDYSSLRIRTYVNGTLDTDLAVGGTNQFNEMTDPGALYIGRAPGGTLSDQAPRVEIDSVRIYNYAMNSSQVAGLFGAGR